LALLFLHLSRWISLGGDFWWWKGKNRIWFVILIMI
jgi:hypothetical protein